LVHREQSYEENAGKLIETDESLLRNGQRTFRPFTLKKKDVNN